jgi:hypothetical protein
VVVAALAFHPLVALLRFRAVLSVRSACAPDAAFARTTNYATGATVLIIRCVEVDTVDANARNITASLACWTSTRSAADIVHTQGERTSVWLSAVTVSYTLDADRVRGITRDVADRSTKRAVCVTTARGARTTLGGTTEFPSGAPAFNDLTGSLDTIDDGAAVNKAVFRRFARLRANTVEARAGDCNANRSPE